MKTVKMDKTYKGFFHTEDSFLRNEKRVENYLSEFSCHFMNNAKWRKVFRLIFSNPNLIRHCEIVDFFSESVVLLRTELQNVNFEDFIYMDCIDNYITTGEYAISYKEIEYLGFRKTWTAESIGKLVPPKAFEQDIRKIKSILSEIGEFKWECSDNLLKLIAYQ